MIAFLIISIGMTRKASIIQMSQDLGERLSTLRTFPPNVTNMNCIAKIANMTIRKLLFLPNPSNGFKWLVLALKPLNVIAIINVANNADFRYVTPTSPNRFLTGGKKSIERQINAMYAALTYPY